MQLKIIYCSEISNFDSTTLECTYYRDTQYAATILLGISVASIVYRWMYQIVYIYKLIYLHRCCLVPITNVTTGT